MDQFSPQDKADHDDPDEEVGVDDFQDERNEEHYEEEIPPSAAMGKTELSSNQFALLHDSTDSEAEY